MKALISGSLAFDTVMLFEGSFKDHLLPEELHILNVSFIATELKNNFGGCAGNSAYGMHLLGVHSTLVCSVGNDFQDYMGWLQKSGVDCDHLFTASDTVTARAFILTDLDNNQITAFHAGAMQQSHLAHIPKHGDHKIALLSPAGREGMLTHANELADKGIPFLFDPGQGTPMFSGEEMLSFIKRAEWLACNDYELHMIEKKCQMDTEALRKEVSALVVTKGDKGSVIYAADKEFHIPATMPDRIVDPTGCGDAHRAGLIFGLLHKLDWETTGRIASLMGTLNVEQSGTQSYSFTPEKFSERFRNSFGFPPWED